jgi:hypothetical protein
MFCSKCGKKIPTDSIFCLYCGTRQVADSLPGKPENLSSISDETSNFGFVIISSKYDQEQTKKDPKIPDWVRKFYPEFDHCVLVWNVEFHQTYTFFAFEALDILEDCKISNQWKTEGIPVIQKSTQINLPSAYSKKALAAKEKQSTNTTQTKEIFRINGKDAEGFVSALFAREQELEDMRDSDEKRTVTLFLHCYASIFNDFQEQEEKKIDLAYRQLKWSNEQKLHWTCEKGTFTGIVKSDQIYFQPPMSRISDQRKQVYSPSIDRIAINLGWKAEVKSAERNYYQGKIFTHLEEALNWVENEMLSVKDEPVDDTPDFEEPDVFILTEDYREKLSPYWIDPTSICPEQITYQSLILLSCKHESSEIYTCLSGKQIEINQKYPSPAGLAVRLGLDRSSVKFEQVVPDFEWYRTVSLTRFYQQQVAIDFAQELWEKSNILKMFHDDIILSAKYGYQEVETQYTVFLGECSPEDHRVSKEKSRSEYLTDLALRYTLINALDVSAYRSLLGISIKDFSDEDLLCRLHYLRAKCPFVSAEAIAESIKWIRNFETKSSVRITKDKN